MEIGRQQGIIVNAHIKIGSNSYEKVGAFKYLGSLLTNQNSIQEEIKCRLKAGNSCYYSVQTLFNDNKPSFNFALEYAIRKVQETNLGLNMNGTHQVLAYAGDVNLIE